MDNFIGCLFSNAVSTAILDMRVKLLKFIRKNFRETYHRPHEINFVPNSASGGSDL